MAGSEATPIKKIGASHHSRDVSMMVSRWSMTAADRSRLPLRITCRRRAFFAAALTLQEACEKPP